MLKVTLITLLAVAATAKPQGAYLPPGSGAQPYGSSRGSSVQGSALPRRFSVGSTSSQYGSGSSSNQYSGSGSNSLSSLYRPSPYNNPNSFASKASSFAGQYGASSAGGYSQATSQYAQSAGGYSQSAGQFGAKSDGGYNQGQYASQSVGGYSQGQYAGQSAGGYGQSPSQYGGGATEDPLAEPANYEFAYEVNAPESGAQFGHQESRQDDFTKGSYRVLLPDGRTQVVEYEADQDGYRPTVTYQQPSGGYGGNGGYSNGGYSGNGNNGRYVNSGNSGNSVYAGNNGYANNGSNGGYANNGENGGYANSGNYASNGNNGGNKY